jgi:acetyl-CoA carboxylase carboxyl transferase subunit beta
VSWINNIRPKIRGLLTTKRELPDNLWVKCPDTGQMVFYKDLEANQFVIPGSNYHMRMDAQKRLAHLFDEGEYAKVQVGEVPLDPLKFRDGKRYSDRLKTAKSDTQLDDAVLVGEGRLEGQEVVAAAQDFRFMAGSLGMAAGEAVITGMRRAVDKGCPFILFAASGGARMQEGILSLMQMPRTTIAVQMLREARLPYLVVLTDPTTGGVTASYAMLGDVHIAEPGALICFAGPRVIQQTIREQLPEGFQKAEYLLAHGMIDMVVHRHQLRETLARLCRLLTDNPTVVHVSRSLAAKGAERGYLNGSTVTGNTIETLARSYGDVMEPGPTEDDERETTRDPDAKSRTRPGSRDGARG